MLRGATGAAFLAASPSSSLTLGPGEWRGAFLALRSFLRRNHERCCVGFLGYDLALDVEPFPVSIEDDFPQPVLHFSAYDRILRFPPSDEGDPPPLPRCALRPSIPRADYERRVLAVVEHIRAGDIFQANLTQPFTGEFGGDPRILFWRLCRESPAPFSAYLETGEGTAVISSSPEEFLRLQGRRVRTRPIKGTRPRDPDPARDAALLRELCESEKDLAELAMIVDLMRNDLGKVAVPGSVEVGPFPERRSFEQVHHLFATVTAELLPRADAVDLLLAAFPGGSISGCPKLRCLEILESLEVVRRGVFTGAIGWIGPGSEMHLNLAIRTLVHRNGLLRANAGGGITSLSDPAAEYDETLQKMAGIARALGEPIRTCGARP
ncbi:MAG: aminodeoxychorismate synthase component I [Planctomycetota bacterium]